MATQLRALMVDVGGGLYRIDRYRLGDFFGPIDLGYYLSTHHDCLSFGVGLLAGSIFPGSNRLFFTGSSPCWHGFYVSSMGGAGLVFDNLGISMVSLVGRAPTPSILYLNRLHGEEIQVEVKPVDLAAVWHRQPGGVYSVMEEALARYGERFVTDPRVLAVGPAAATTDLGAIASAPISRGGLTPIDTWAGRGGFGTRLLKQHGLAAIIFGGTFVDEDFRDRKVADQWFEGRYQKKLMAKDLEATVKYRFDPAFETGGTFGVNYAKLGGRILAFNYRSINWDEEERLDLHERFIQQHYLDQFNQETIKTKSMRHCGEPCPAVCKKLRDTYKKDFEPYQTMGPLCGVFDQRAAERLTHHADRLGFDAISVGGVLSWLMECLDDQLIEPAELGVKDRPVFTTSGFDLVGDSMHNAELGIGLLDVMVSGTGPIDLERGARRFARELARQRGPELRDRFLYIAFGRRGWMVPNQYWTPGVLSPMAMMGKYYMHYGSDYLPPRELGRYNARRMIAELTVDNLGYCRFHRKWAEEMLPEIVGSLFGLKDEYQQQIAELAVRINSHNAAVPWETSRAIDYVHSFLRRRYEVEGDRDVDLSGWLDRFNQDRREAALEYWFEILKGVHETFRG